MPSCIYSTSSALVWACFGAGFAGLDLGLRGSDGLQLLRTGRGLGQALDVHVDVVGRLVGARLQVTLTLLGGVDAERERVSKGRKSSARRRKM